MTLGNPSPTATFCVVADEGNTDGSVGDGWSHSGLTDFTGYGYIHGGCVDHEDGSSGCGLGDTSSTFEPPSLGTPDAWAARRGDFWPILSAVAVYEE